jgi:hypothetical protein
MIDLILKDSELRPEAFDWWGALPLPKIEAWEREQSVRVPPDLKRLWSTKGGGDLFDSETILQPFDAAEYDLIGPASVPFWQRGLSTHYCVFQTGLCNSVFRKSDGAIFALKSKANLSEMFQFSDLDYWYKQSLREAFAKGYDLPPVL